MAKVPTYTLAWSPTTETYELYQTRDREGFGIVPDSPQWFGWLDQVSSFAFVGKRGRYTARKETRQRGDRYWSAYLATSEQLNKKYLGKTTALTLARLEDIAGVLHTSSETQAPPLVSQTVDANSGVDATQHPLLAKNDPLYPLLATKLHAPRQRTHLVPRAQLTECLQEGVTRPLTLVSAPAGFGKTTLLAQWLTGSKMPVAWLSLEAEDNDPTRFLSYVIAALQTLDAQFGTSIVKMLHTPQPPSPEAVLAVLTNDLAGREAGDFTLVLDDYHVITAEPIQHGMTFLLEHLPSQMHLILATRADPPLPLARLRASGQLTEVRAADLRFGAAETSAFLQEVMGLNLPAEAIATLESQTEGWIAGLQLAALSLQGRSDISTFLAGFKGSHRYVLDYLSDEVLARQPSPVQTFLLHTCVLERLSGSLCDAVTGQQGGQTMLEALERANLFVVALDDERGWYRYHHLFAQALRRHLQQVDPPLLPVLHRRASAWYEQHELPAEAVQHALAVPNVELAARLIEPIALPALSKGQFSTLLGWMKALPESLVQTRPFLCVYHAGLLALINQLGEAEARLQQAERGAQHLAAEQAQIILGYVLSIRGYLVLLTGDIPQAVSLAHKALALLPEGEILPRAGALATMDRAYLLSGDVTSATEQAIATAVAFVRGSDILFSNVTGITLLARLYILQGRLRQAAATFEQVVQMVPRTEVLQTLFGSLFYYFSLGDLLREWNNLEAAEQHLRQGMVLIKETLTVEPFVAILGYTALARVQQARDNTHEALATLDALMRLAERRHFAPLLLPRVAALHAQLELAQGNLAAAIRWADSSGLSAGDEDLPYPRESDYLALARVRIAQMCDDAASPLLQDVLRLLDRLLGDAERKERMDSVLQILVVHALALKAQGDLASALSTLERALMLAAPEGYIRLFVDEGPLMLALLRLARGHGISPEYVATLLSAFGEQHTSEFPIPVIGPGQLAEPLTRREHEVLQLLLAGASNREIARRLVLSLNTVKRHVYNLCGKLGVQSRTQAIVRARDLHLV